MEGFDWRVLTAIVIGIAFSSFLHAYGVGRANSKHQAQVVRARHLQLYLNCFIAGGLWSLALVCSISCAQHYASAANIHLTLGNHCSINAAYLLWLLGLIMALSVDEAVNLAGSNRYLSAFVGVTRQSLLNFYFGAFMGSRACWILVANASLFFIAYSWTISRDPSLRAASYSNDGEVRRLAILGPITGSILGNVCGFLASMASGQSLLAVWNSFIVGLVIFFALEFTTWCDDMSGAPSADGTWWMTVEADSLSSCQEAIAGGHAQALLAGTTTPPYGGWKRYALGRICLLLGCLVSVAMTLAHEAFMGWQAMSVRRMLVNS